MCGIAQQRIEWDHALGHTTNPTSVGAVSKLHSDFSTWVSNGFPMDFQWISNGSSMDLHQVFGALLILLQTFTLWQVTTATFEFVLAIAQSPINRLASICWTLSDPPTLDVKSAVQRVQHTELMLCSAVSLLFLCLSSLCDSLTLSARQQHLCSAVSPPPLSCPSFFFSSLTPPAPLYSAQQWFPDLTLFENLQNPAPLRCPRSCMAPLHRLSLHWPSEKNPAQWLQGVT